MEAQPLRRPWPADTTQMPDADLDLREWDPQIGMLSIGTVENVPYDEDATATLTGPPSRRKLNLWLRQGIPGTGDGTDPDVPDLTVIFNNQIV